MATTYTAPSISDIILDFFNQLYASFDDWRGNFYSNFTSVSAKRWIRMGIIVGTYLFIIRPLLDTFFRKSFDKKQRKEKEKREAEKAAFGAEGKKAKVSPNSLRGPGKVLGEVETDDEDAVKDEGKATGVSDLGKGARKRQKKYLKGLEREAENTTTDGMTEEELLELLDWSESDEEEEKKK